MTRPFAAHRRYRECCGSLVDEPHDRQCNERTCSDCDCALSPHEGERCSPCARDHHEGCSEDAGYARQERMRERSERS